MPRGVWLGQVDAMGVGQLTTNLNSVDCGCRNDRPIVITKIIDIGQSCHEKCKKRLKMHQPAKVYRLEIFVIDKFNFLGGNTFGMFR